MGQKFPESCETKMYKQEEWYAQFLWPIFKSKKERSPLADGLLSLPVSQIQDTAPANQNIYEPI